MDAKGVDVLSRCRICLGERPVVDMYEMKGRGPGPALPCSEIILLLFTLYVRQNDGLPQKLCRKCYNKLISAYKLKLVAEQSYKRLLEYDAKQLSKDECSAKEFNTENIVVLINKHDIKEENEIKVEAGEITISKSHPNYDESVFYDEELNTYVSDEINTKLSVDQVAAESEDDTPLAYYNKMDSRPQQVPPTNETRQMTNEKPSNKRKIRKGKVNKSRPGVCDLCGKFIRDIAKHYETHSTYRKMYSCGDCPKKFLVRSGLRKHRESQHSGNKYFCEICNKFYRRKSDHIRFKHSNRPVYPCLLCGKQFPGQAQLTIHMTTHTKERPFSCDVCGKTFRTKGVYIEHKRRVHEKEKSKICQICSKGFYSDYHLQDHIRSHTNERIYKCPICDKGFTRKNAISIHKRRHFGIMKVSCQICAKKFVCSGALKSHMITHTKEKIHPCRYCGTMFGRTDHRNKHEKTAHKNVFENEKKTDGIDK